MRFVLPDNGFSSFKKEINQLEEDLIAQALIRSNGVKSAAAKLLGLQRTTLIEKMRRYGFTLEEAPHTGRSAPKHKRASPHADPGKKYIKPFE